MCMHAFLRENKLALDGGTENEHYCREKCLLTAYSSLQEDDEPPHHHHQQQLAHHHHHQQQEQSSSSDNDTPMIVPPAAKRPRHKYPPATAADERDPSEQEADDETTTTRLRMANKDVSSRLAAPRLVAETPAFFQRHALASDEAESFKRGNAEEDGSDRDENPLLLPASAESCNTSAAPSPRKEYHPHARMKPPSAAALEERDPEDAAARKLLEKETSRLVMSLVAETPEFQQHPADEGVMSFQREISKSLMDTPPAKRTAPADIPPAFHPIELSDWESEINNWSALDNSKNNNNNGTGTTPDPLAALERPRNHHLDHLTFNDDMPAGGGDNDDYRAELRERARRAPLILELGVAGRSVARRVYQELSSSQQHPAPAVRSAAYRDRLEREASTAAAGSRARAAQHFGGGRTVPYLSMGPGGRLTIIYYFDVWLVFGLLTHSLFLSLFSGSCYS